MPLSSPAFRLRRPAARRRPAGGVDPAVGMAEAAAPPVRDPGPSPAPPAAGYTLLRVTRLIVPPGASRPAEQALAATALLVETGELSVVAVSHAPYPQNLDAARIDATLRAGEWLVIDSGAVFAVRNDGPTLGEALAVTVLSSASPASCHPGPSGS